MSTNEPGLDRHEWESEFETLEPELRAAPAEALPDLGHLVQRMLEERGYELGDPVAQNGDEREVLSQYLAAREVTERVDRGENVDPGDIAAAVDSLRAVYDHVLAARKAP